MPCCLWCWCFRTAAIQEEVQPILPPPAPIEEDKDQITASINEILQYPQCNYCQRAEEQWLQRKREMKQISYEDHQKWTKDILNTELNDFRLPMNFNHSKVEENWQSMVSQMENLRVVFQNLNAGSQRTRRNTSKSFKKIVKKQEKFGENCQRMLYLVANIFFKIVQLMDLMMFLHKSLEHEAGHKALFRAHEYRMPILNKAGVNMEVWSNNISCLQNELNVLILDR